MNFEKLYNLLEQKWIDSSTKKWNHFLSSYKIINIRTKSKSIYEPEQEGFRPERGHIWRGYVIVDNPAGSYFDCLKIPKDVAEKFLILGVP